jgi:hypothetical protein
MSKLLTACGVVAIALPFGAPSATDQRVSGEGNGAAAALAERSPLVQSAMTFMRQHARLIRNDDLRRATMDILDTPATCVRHRVGMSETRSSEVLERLRADGLIDPSDETRHPGGLKAGVFPPVIGGDTSCPRLPQPYWAAPGGSFVGHHSHPGGLALHAALNLSNALALAANYRQVYGATGRDGLPRVGSGEPPAPGRAAIVIDQDIMIAAPI